MTLPEIFAAINKPQEPSPHEVIEVMEAYKLLSLEERLDLAYFLLAHRV